MHRYLLKIAVLAFLPVAGLLSPDRTIDRTDVEGPLQKPDENGPILLKQGIPDPVSSSGSMTDGQKQLVARLTGHRPVSGTIALQDRNSPANRRLAANYLTGSLRKIGVEPRQQAYSYPNVSPFVDVFFKPFRGINVCGDLPATVPSDEYVVLGAHYDGVKNSPAATDNACGAALVWGVARELVRLPDRKVNFIFVFFDQEEEDEIGSKAFAKNLISKGVNVHSVHTADLVGWDGDGDRAVEIQSSSREVERLYQKHADALGIPLTTISGASSDNGSFMAAGFSAVGISDEWVNGDSSPHRDRPSDTYAVVNFGYLGSTTRLVSEVLKAIAGGHQNIPFHVR